jgi:hypothetical protein
MIESDIKGIKEAHRKTNKALKEISVWQTKHEKIDLETKEEILAKVFTKDEMVLALGDAIDTKINGKLIGISKHLEQQDIDRESDRKMIEDLTTKILPLDGAKTWVWELGKVILYLGGLALALVGIITLYNLFFPK